MQQSKFNIGDDVLDVSPCARDGEGKSLAWSANKLEICIKMELPTDIKHSWHLNQQKGPYCSHQGREEPATNTKTERQSGFLEND